MRQPFETLLVDLAPPRDIIEHHLRRVGERVRLRDGGP
jgi:hypothetical protein